MKKTKSILTGLFILTLLGVLSIYSCKKSSGDEEVISTFDESAGVAAEDESLVSNSAEDIHSMSDEAFTGNLTSFKTGGSSLLSCVDSIIRDTAGIGPHMITIDFGIGSSICKDFRFRKGQVIITWTGPYWMPGTVITVTTNNYYVSDNGSTWHQIILTKKVTNNGMINPPSDSSLTVHVTDTGRIIKNDGGIITFNIDRTRILSNWQDNMTNLTNRCNDVIKNYGTNNGITSNGYAYSVSISPNTPLTRLVCQCRHFVSGIATLVVEKNGESKTLSVDFGAGDASACGGTNPSCSAVYVTYTKSNKTVSKTVCLK